MRNTNLLGLTAFAILSAFCSCADEDIISSSSPTGNTVIVAQIEGGNQTRTYVGDANQVFWTEEDSLSVFDGTTTTSSPFALLSVNSDGSAHFTGDIQSGGTPTMAFYPYNASVVLKGNKLSVKLPTEYDYTLNSNGPMIGFPDEDGKFTFIQLWGMLRFSINDIPSGARKIVAESHYWDTSLTGWFHINDVTADSLVLTETRYSGNSHEIIYNFPDTVSGGSHEFCIPLPPANYTEGGTLYPFYIKLEDADGNVLWKKPIYNLEIKRGVITTLPATDTEPKIVITSHANGDTIKGYGAIKTITIEGYIDNYYKTNGQVLLTSQGNIGEGVIGDYIIKYDGYYNPQGLPTGDTHNGHRHYFTLEDVEIRPGENVFAFDLAGESTGGETISGTMNFVINYEENNTPADKVDLGAAGVWASHNMGASKPEEIGFPYKWADKTGTMNTHSGYIYMADTVDVMSIAGDIRFDAATYKWGDGWEMPTDYDFVRLCQYTTKEDCSLNGVQGIKFTADNGNSIFLPCVKTTEDGTTENAYYWTSCKYYDVFGVSLDCSRSFGDGGKYYNEEETDTNIAVIGHDFRHGLLYIRPVYK